MKFSWFFPLILGSCFEVEGPPPLIIERAASPEPLWSVLARMGEDAVDPVLARGDGIQIRRSQLLSSVLSQHGRESLVDLVRCEAGLQRMQEEKIVISAEAVELRAREILADLGTSMTDYLATRAIDKTTWVNEIALVLGFEKLCRAEMLQRGAALVQARTFPTESEARAEGALEGAESSWVSDFLLPDGQIRKSIFPEGVADSVVRVPDGFLAMHIVKRAGSASDLATYKPTKRALELYLDLLVSVHKMEYLWDRAYHELDKIQPVGTASEDNVAPSKEKP